MTICSSQSRLRRAWSATLAALLLALALPLVASGSVQAQRQGPPQMQRGPSAAQPEKTPSAHGGQSQVSLRSEFRTALEPHGRWQNHARWGDVWIPANRPGQWRPYTAGRWVYTNDWGWYWVSDDAEARWGWVTYHYGRWAFDDALGWCWVPGEEWSPGWVQWRRPRADVEYVGWSPLPPDEIIVEYVDQPRFWTFVRGRDFIAPRLASVIVPVDRYNVFFRETVVVNRTLLVDNRARFAVNPGIAPTVIATATRQPLRAYDVRPTVLAGSAAIPGAMQVRPENLRSRDFRPQTALQPTQNVVRAADRVQPAQPLAAGERGRLGDMPPRAAQRGPQAPSTTGQAPGTSQPAQPQPQQQGQPQPQQAQPPQQQQQQQGQRQPPQQQRQQPSVQQQQRSPTEGRGAAEQRQAPSNERREATPQQRQQPSVQQQRPPTEGRGATEQRQPPSSERRAATPQQRQQPSVQQQRPSTEGRGAAEPRQAPQSERRAVTPQQSQQPSAQPQRQQPNAQQQRPTTEGRGSGGPPSGGAGATPQRAPGGGGPGGGRGQGPGG